MADELNTSSASRPLVSFVAVDPELLPLGTPPGYTFRYIDIASATQGRLSIPDDETEYRNAPSRARRVLRDGDVIMSTVRPNLKAFAFCQLPAGNFVASTGFAVLRAREETHPRFILYSILSDDVTRQIERFVVGSNYPALNSSDVRRLLIPNLSPAEQQRIGEIIGTVDVAIDQTEALIAKSQQIKAGLMHDLFARGVTADGQLRSAASSSNTPFGSLPEGWVAGSLLDVADDKRQPILTGPFGADLGNDDFVEEGVPVLRIGNVQAGHLDLADLLFVTPGKALELQRYVIRSGDLLFARQGATTGRNALARDLVDGCLINYHIIRVGLDHEKCAPIFIEAAFNGEMVKRQVEREKGRGTREGINTAQLKALKVPLAPVSEQRLIAEILGTQNEHIQYLVQELRKLRKAKHGLLQDLLTARDPDAVVATHEQPKVAANV
jgi:type I restriction enzyme S subunit